MFLQGVSCLPAPGDTYHLNDCMVFADVKLTGIPMVVLVVLLGVSMVLIQVLVVLLGLSMVLILVLVVLPGLGLGKGTVQLCWSICSAQEDKGQNQMIFPCKIYFPYI